MPLPWVAIGLIGQGCFFTRFLLQWLASERAKQSVVPRHFWRISLVGSLCVLAYALAAHDPVFVLATLPTTFIYIRNMLIRRPASAAQLAAPALALAAFVIWAVWSEPRIDNLFWSVLGLTGSLVWSSRFLVQWWMSERRGMSTLPAAFWIMSLVGNVLMLSYAIHRRDPVFIPGQSLGFVVYLRNLWLLQRSRGSPTED